MTDHDPELELRLAGDEDIDYEEPREEQPPPEDEDTDYPTEEPREEQPPPEDEDTDYPGPGDAT